MTASFEHFAVWRATEEAPKPDVSFVPPLDRRRLTGVERAALSVAWQVKSDAELPVVFASRWGEIGAAPGAFSLLTKNHAPYTAIAARDRSLEAGLLEALAMHRDTIFVYAEESTPEFYLAEFGKPQPACAVAVRISMDKQPTGAVRSVTFRHEDLPPASFEDFVTFLEGRTCSFPTSDLLLT